MTKEIEQLARKVSHNYRLIIFGGAFLYSCFLFYNQQIVNTSDIHDLKSRIDKCELNQARIESETAQTLADINRQLIGISTDLQLIKTNLISEGLKHGAKN